MTEFRLTQISDTHLARRHQTLTETFTASASISTPRGPISSSTAAISPSMRRPAATISNSPRTLHAALPVPCRYLPGNHDIGDNPTAVGPAPPQPATEQDRQSFLSMFGEDRWRFEAAGWCFIGLNSLIMNTGLASEAEQFDWLASQLAARRRQAGRAVPAQAALSQLARRSRTRGIRDTLRSACRRAAGWSRCSARSICGWSPPATSISAAISPIAASVMSGRRRRLHHSGARQEVIGVKETGLVEYRFRPTVLKSVTSGRRARPISIWIR